MKVDVYRNLHKKCMSVRSREKDDYGRVVSHLNSLLLGDCKFVVRPAGRIRVILDKRKNVHAFVRGTLKIGYGRPYDLSTIRVDKWVEVTYNPYMFETFVVKSTGQPIMKADQVLMIDGKVYARDGV